MMSFGSECGTTGRRQLTTGCSGRSAARPAAEPERSTPCQEHGEPVPATLEAGVAVVEYGYAF